MLAKPIPILTFRQQRWFWRKVQIRGIDECWPWIGARDREGYGRVVLNGGMYLAHRISFALSIRPPRPDLRICHECDNPPCCNPGHYFEGTDAENKLDCVKKGRVAHFNGIKNPNAKLSPEVVAEIRKHLTNPRFGLRAQLSRRYGVHWTTIEAVRKQVTWRGFSNSQTRFWPPEMPPSSRVSTPFQDGGTEPAPAPQNNIRK